MLTVYYVSNCEQLKSNKRLKQQLSYIFGAMRRLPNVWRNSKENSEKDHQCQIVKILATLLCDGNIKLKNTFIYMKSIEKCCSCYLANFGIRCYHKPPQATWLKMQQFCPDSSRFCPKHDCYLLFQQHFSVEYIGNKKQMKRGAKKLKEVIHRNQKTNKTKQRYNQCAVTAKRLK